MSMRLFIAAMVAVATTTVTVHAQNGKALAALAQDLQNTIVLRYLGILIRSVSRCARSSQGIFRGQVSRLIRKIQVTVVTRLRRRVFNPAT
jgi:hypothetical protein